MEANKVFEIVIDAPGGSHTVTGFHQNFSSQISLAYAHNVIFRQFNFDLKKKFGAFFLNKIVSLPEIESSSLVLTVPKGRKLHFVAQAHPIFYHEKVQNTTRKLSLSFAIGTFQVSHNLIYIFDKPRVQFSRPLFSQTNSWIFDKLQKIHTVFHFAALHWLMHFSPEII